MKNLVLISATFLCFVGMGCDQNRKPISEPNVIVAVMPLSGPISYLGQQEMAGLAIGIDDFNKENPDKRTPLKLIVEDTQGQTKNAATIAQKYAEREDVLAMVVTTSGAVLAVSPILEASKIPLAAIASDTDITEQSPVIFRPYMSFDTEAEVVAKFVSQQKWRRVAFVRGEAEVFANEVSAMRKRFAQEGIEIVADEAYPLTNRDFRTILGRIARAQPDVLIALSWGFEVGALLEQKMQNPDTASLPLIGGYAFLTDPAVKEGAELMDGHYVVAFAAAYNNPELDDLRSRIESRFGFRPNQFLDFAATYDVPFILGTARKETSKRSELSQAISGIGEFQGISGTYNFTDSRDGMLPLRVMQYRNGDLQPTGQ